MFSINRAVYSTEFQKYLFDDFLPAEGDIYVTSGNGQDYIHVYTGTNQHFRFRILRLDYDDYNQGTHQVGYSCLDADGSKVNVKFMFKEGYVDVYFFFETTAIIYSVKPPGRF